MAPAAKEGQNSALQSEQTKRTEINTLAEARWYAVQVASGCEKRVKTNIEQRIQTFDVADKILQVEIPHTPTVKIRRDGSRHNAEEKVFPGYVLIRMLMDEDSWQVVKNTSHVINFVGSEQKRGTLKALLSIFGRDTPVELEFNQVKKQT